MGRSAVRRALAVLAVLVIGGVAAPSAQAAWSLPKFSSVYAPAKTIYGGWATNYDGIQVGSAVDPAVWPAGLRKTTWFLKASGITLAPNCGVDVAKSWNQGVATVITPKLENNRWVYYNVPWADFTMDFRCDSSAGPSTSRMGVKVPANTLDALMYPYPYPWTR